MTTIRSALKAASKQVIEHHRKAQIPASVLTEMDQNPPFFEDEGIIWTGSREELAAWKAYKQRKVIAFVERGYSVEWYRDGDGWISVYVPERRHVKAPEVRAEVKFFGRPSHFGIEDGMVSKLSIQRRWTNLVAKVFGDPWERVETLYNYDRGHDVNRLSEDPVAEALYHAIIEELN